jgi:PAS domain S-box-containing protein
MNNNNTVDIEKHFETFDIIGDAVSIQDKDYKVLYQNDAHIGLVGRHIGEYCYKAYEKKNHRCKGCPIARTFEDGNRHKAERKAPLDNGHLHVEITSSPIKDSEGNIIAGVELVRDITSRKHAKVELEKIFDLTPDMLCVAGPDGYFKKLNKSWENVLGYSIEELQLKPFMEFIHPDDREDSIKQFDKLLAGQKVFYFENRYQCKDGTYKVLAWNANPVENNKIYAAARDITEKKHIEEELKESEEKYRKIFNNEIDAISIFDIETRKFLDVNAAFLKLYGYSREEALQLRVDDVSAEPDTSKEAIKKSVANGDTLIPRRLHKKKDGSEITVELSAGPFTWKGKKIMFAVVRDITPRVKAEKAFSESEKNLKELIETVNDWIWTVDSQGIYTYVSPRVKDLLGYNPEEVLGKTPFDFMPAEEAEKINKLFSEKVRRKESFNRLENVNIHKDGRKVVLETSGSPVLDHDGTLLGYRGVDRDVSDRKQLEEELLKVQKLESTGILAGGIAHDFNNILTAILGNISIAKMFAESNEKVLKRLIAAEKASMRAQDLSQQLLTFSKGGEPIKKPTKIIELIKDSASFSLTGSNVMCDLFMADKLWPVNIDEGQISQVIQNVVKNADQAMPDGGTIIIQAENKTISGKNMLPLKDGKYVWITIKDQGGGIPEKHIARIFDPYFSTKQEGSGLGLAASFSIVKKHDGLISAESELGEGTTLHIYLPVSGKVSPVQKQVIEKPLQSGEKILIMDDDQAILEIATQMLNMMGFKTESATNGQEAVALYKKAQKSGRPFGAVVLDLTISGGMGGKETVKHLVDIDPDIQMTP